MIDLYSLGSGHIRISGSFLTHESGNLREREKAKLYKCWKSTFSPILTRKYYFPLWWSLDFNWTEFSYPYVHVRKKDSCQTFMIKGKMPTYINSESARLYCNFADVDQRSDETMCVAGTE